MFISSVLQFTSFKSHEEKVKVICFHTPGQGCLPGKTGYLNPKSNQGRHRRIGEGKTSCSEGHTAATSSGKSIAFCLSQFSGCLKDPGLPISSLFWHIYIGSGSAQCGRWSPLGWAGETLPFPFYGFKCLKQLGAPWFNEASSNLTPKSLKTSLSTAVPPIFTITWKPELFSSSPNDGCVYTSFRSYQDNQLSLVTWLRFN